MSSRLSAWIRLAAVNLLVTAILLAVVLACAEGYLRLTLPASSGGSLFESTTQTPRYKMMKPEARIVAWGSEFRTNRLGFRDDQPDIPPKKAGGFRTIVLGDSFTAAAGVDFDRIYTTLVEKRFAQAVPGAEVINLAVGGYNVIQYEMVLDEVGLSLQPDLIIAAIFPFNDLSHDTYRANRDDALGRSTPAPPIPWYEQLYVYGAFLGRVEGRIRSWLPPAAGRASDHASAESVREADARENLEALGRIVRTAMENGIELVVVLLPNTDSTEAQRGDFAPFESLCDRERWRCLNLLDRFEKSGVSPASLRLNRLDPHPNVRYNELVASFLADYLLADIDRLKKAPR